MIKHTRDVIIAALTQWMLTGQYDTGCDEAGATAVFNEMLRSPYATHCATGVAYALCIFGNENGSLAAQCATSVATALSVYGDTGLLPDLCIPVDLDATAPMLNHAFRKIVEARGKCTRNERGEAHEEEDLALGGPIRPVAPPDDQHLRN